MRKSIWVILVATLLVLVVVLVGWVLPHRRGQAEAYRTDTIQRGEVRVQVSATGTLNAVTTVQVGSQVTGTIAALYADFNDPVREGQVLALLDPTFLKAQVAQNEADLERARVQVRQAERDYARQKPLREQGLASQAEADATETALDAARASEKAAEASLERGRTNLRYATITCPIDGVVISRNVDVGQTVAASLSAPTLFTIAKDLTQMQLEAAVDEADIGLVRVGQPVTFTVDAFPDRSFQGTVQQIRLAPQTIQNVVSYTVIVRVQNPDQALLPGMTANATFLIEEARDVLKVSSAAFLFRPPQVASAREHGGSAGRPAHAAGADQVLPPGLPAGQGPILNGASARPAAVPLFLLRPDGKLRRVMVQQGISDGTFTAVTSDSLSEGMTVVVALNRSPQGGGQGTVNPFMPGGGRRDRR